MKKSTLKQRFKKLFFQGLFVVFAFGFYNESVAQLQNNSIVHISDNTSLFLGTGTYTFGASPALTQTTRTAFNFGRLIFGPMATSDLASDSHYVDGYVTTIGNSEFVFPIGDGGKYAPAKIIPVVSSEINGAYYDVNPISTYGSLLNASVLMVSPIEYWDLNSVDSAVVSLSWRLNSNISALTNNDLSKLIIVGYNGSEWVEIPSQVDALSFTSVSSTLDSGTITSTSSVNLNSFNAFSFGSKADLSIQNFDTENVVAMLYNENLTVQASDIIENIQVCDLSGRNIEEYKGNGLSSLTKKFYHPQGVYLVKIKLSSGIFTTKKLMNNR